MEKERTIIFKRKENTPYDFNINEEYKKYESIGDNKSELKTYKNWESHIINKCSQFTETTRLNFVHYIKGKKRSEENKIAATMQKENYTLRNTVSFNKYRAISMYILLATQIKSDVTGIRVSPELWLEMKITDYANNKDEFKKVNNDIVRELKLGSSFCI